MIKDRTEVIFNISFIVNLCASWRWKARRNGIGNEGTVQKQFIQLINTKGRFRVIKYFECAQMLYTESKFLLSW